MKKIVQLSVVVFLLGFTACKKDKKNTVTPTPAPATGSLKISFEHVVDSNMFVMNHNYVNANSDTFKVSMLKYYISNIVLTKSDNSTYTEANSYHLIDNSVSTSTLLTLAGIPPGAYKSISFMLGVDSARNVSGVQTGDLDPGRGMFWSWIGYTMLKFEGTSPQSGASDKSLTFHIGGYGGVDKTQRNFAFNFTSTPANVSTTATPLMHLSVNVNELFKNPTVIQFATQFEEMTPGHVSRMYADNYADMISFKNITN